jgi:hypothetical protein
MNGANDNVSGLRFEILTVAGQVTLNPMRFQPRFFPHPVHPIFADAQLAASLRQLQCVDPSAGFFRTPRIRARKASGRMLGGWPG